MPSLRANADNRPPSSIATEHANADVWTGDRMMTPDTDLADVRARRPSRRTGLARLPGGALRALLTVRTAALMVLEPLDYAARRLNGKKTLPPMALRRYAGPLATLEASGAEFLAYLKLLCGATSESRILDIGCGFGLMALYLEGHLAPPGKYVGVDINNRAITWAKRKISSRLPNFEFYHLDIRNGMYNPKGRLSPENILLPLPSQSFDIVLLKSVFTHLRPPEVTNYLREMGRLLDPNGKCLATFFLLNHDQQQSRARGQNAIDFRFGNDSWRYAIPAMPELAVAYSESYLIQLIVSAGLAVDDIHYGTWSGRSNGLSYQDVVTVRLHSLIGPERR